MAKKIELEQGSLEWLDFRKNRIGASDYPVLCADEGLVKNIFLKKPLDIIKSKNSPQKANYVMQRGHNIEAELRHMASEMLGFTLESAVYVDDEHDWLLCSLDGYNNDNPGHHVNVEIKLITANRKNTEGLLEYYAEQVRHQAYIMNSDKGYLFICYEGREEEERYKLYEIDLKKDERHFWLERCTNFYNNFILPTLNVDVASIFEAKIDIIKTLEQQIEQAQKRIEELKEELRVEYPDGFVSDRYTYTHIYKTTVDWQSIIGEIKDSNYLKPDYAKYAKDNNIKSENYPSYVTKAYSYSKIVDKVK